MEFFNDLYDTLYIIWQQMLLMMYEVILNAAVGAGLLESASCFPVETTSILHTVWYYVAISLGFIKPQTCYTYNGRILGASGYTVVNLGTIKSNSNAPPPFSGMSLVTRLQHPLYTDIKGLVIAIAVVACIIALFKIQWLPKHPEIVQDLRDAFLEARRKQAAASDVRIEHLSSELLSLTDQKQSLEDSNQSLRAAISLLKSFCNIEIESMSMAFNEHLNVFAIQVDRDLCKLGHKHQTTVQKLQTEKEQLWKNEGALTRRNQELSDLTVKITSDEREAFKFSYRNPLENAQTAVDAPYRTTHSANILSSHPSPSTQPSATNIHQCNPQVLEDIPWDQRSNEQRPILPSKSQLSKPFGPRQTIEPASRLPEVSPAAEEISDKNRPSLLAEADSTSVEAVVRFAAQAKNPVIETKHVDEAGPTKRVEEPDSNGAAEAAGMEAFGGYDPSAEAKPVGDTQQPKSSECVRLREEELAGECAEDSGPSQGQGSKETKRRNKRNREKAKAKRAKIREAKEAEVTVADPA